MAVNACRIKPDVSAHLQIFGFMLADWGATMTFSEFARLLYPYCGDGKTKPDFVLVLIDNLMEAPKDDTEQNPLAEMKIGTREKYFNGSLSFSKRKAGIIFKRAYKENFSEFIGELSPETLEKLGEDLCKSGINITDKSVGDVCADVFAKIIEGIAKQENLFEVVENISEPYKYEVGTVDQNTSVDSDINLLMEANRICPFCAKALVDTKGNSSLKQYKIVAILPIEPTINEISILGELLDNPADRNSFNNKIPLCLECANSYLTLLTKEECERLLDIKNRIQRNYIAVQMMDKMPLEKDIEAVLRGISNASYEELTDTLTYDVLKIKDKIPTTNVPLIIKTEGLVMQYYKYIRELFDQLQREINLDFDDVASDVKSSYRRLRKQNLTQDEIFASLTEWFKINSNTNNTIACEIIVAFFVQNCEVFDEIAK